MIRILASDGIEKKAAEKLEKLGCEVVQQFYQPEELGDALKDFDCLVVRSATKVRQPIIDKALSYGRLKLIIRGGVGVDNIDVAYAKEHGINVTNTPNASSSSVAELAIAHMFSLARFIGISNHTMRNGEWNKKQYEGIELAGKTLGIIGYGRIGRSIGEKARALGMKTIAYDAYPCVPEEYNVSLDKLLAESDFITLHIPAAKDSKPFINAETIAKMKDGAYIINTARGALIDEDALCDALDSGKLAGAGIDVYKEEPTKNERLYTHAKVSLTPHIGGSTKEAQGRIGDEIVSIISAQFGLR